jgi:cysteine desulfurase
LYLDHHATTPVDARVLETMLPYFAEHFGNAESSQHPYGWKAKAAVDRAREQVATLLNAEPGEIIFTSGATESIHMAILGLLEDRGPGRHLITSNAEHKCVLEVSARAAKHGHDVTVLPVDCFGRVSVEEVRQAIRPNTVLVSLMHGNNEIGTLNPIAAIGAMLAEVSRERMDDGGAGGVVNKSDGTGEPIVFHVDAAQTVGKHEIDVRAMNIGLLSLSGHKFYAPKGVGALFVRRHSPRVHLVPFMTGGGQERGLRGGTHNVPGIVGLGAACELARELMVTETPRLIRQRDRLIEGILSQVDGAVLNGHPSERLCNNVNLTFYGVESGDLTLGLRDIAYSSSSACSSGTVSHVLAAIAAAPGAASNALVSDPLQATMRFGLGRSTRDEDIEFTIARVVESVRNARMA